ncbi:MAG: nucleotidyl transferase AbiEii/AbiGii toxin family protein [bacterium]
MREPLPLATIHDAVLEFLRGRDDVVVFGATAVNAYVDEPRMTQDIDLMSTRAPDLAEELREHLSTRFTIAVRVREVAKAKGYRLFQVQKSGNRHLVDVRSVGELPKATIVQGISIASPPELIAQKVFSYRSRRGQPKGFSDMRDLAVLFLAFPELKSQAGPVLDALRALDANDEVIETWREIVTQEIREPTPDSEFE